MKLLLSSVLLLLLSACSSTPRYHSGRTPYFIWPVKRGVLTQKFKSHSRKHQGIDIAAEKNTPIYATESGRVIYAGKEFNGYGKLIIIEHAGDTWASFYAHLNSFKVSEGERIKKGQVIGFMGKTGRASGVHLHFELRYKLQAVNPLNYLTKSSLLTRR